MADEQTPPAGGAVPPEKTFTQVELDGIVKDRLTRERDKYKDFDAFKQASEKLKGLEDANKSESEKLAARLAAIEQQIGLKDQTIATLTNELTGTKRANLAGSVAGRLGAYDPQDANIIAAISGIDPAGANAEQEIDAALTDLQKRKPYLFKAAPGQGNTQPAVTAFNPAGGAAAESDMQRVQRLQRQSGAGRYGPLG